MPALDPFAPLTGLAAALARGDVRSLELTDFYLDRIRRLDPTLHAFVRVDGDLAQRYARAADERRAAGLPLGPLDGVPVALKDLLEVEGHPTGVGSALWPERVSTTTAAVVRHLLAAGMVPLGKTHMVEFAFGTWGTNPHLGAPQNPWDLATHRVPGGSSSGSGVAVAAGLAPAAIGSDTGGSVRIPAALNGITGLKTSGGLIDTAGAFPLSATLDTLGPMTRSSADAALLTAAMLGDGPAARAFADLVAPEGDAPLAGMRIARLPADQYPLAVEPAVAAAVDAAVQVLQALGATVRERRLPFAFDDLMRRNGQLIGAEAWAVHRAYIEDERLPVGAGVRRRVLGGKSISAADYIDALAHRRAACREWIAWMESSDALLTPTVPMAATPLDAVDESVTPMASFTRAGNYLDACGLSLPAGLTDAGLPLGVQLLGRSGTDAALLRIGIAFQRATDWHRRTPDLAPLLRDRS